MRTFRGPIVKTPATLPPPGSMGSIPGQGAKISCCMAQKKGQLHFSKVLACDPGQVHSPLCPLDTSQGRKEQSPRPWPTPAAAGRISHVTRLLCTNSPTIGCCDLLLCLLLLFNNNIIIIVTYYCLAASSSLACSDHASGGIINYCPSSFGSLLGWGWETNV